MSTKTRKQWERQAAYLQRKVDAAICDYAMIREGDRVLVGFSGGIDSFALLRLLDYRRHSCVESYGLVAAHIAGDSRGPAIEMPEMAHEALVCSGIEFHIRELPVSPDEPLPMGCDRCSRYRRKALLLLAQELRCNCLALGHNMDDFAQTALMNLFAHGRLETMSHSAEYAEGAVRLIRPLAYVTRHEIRRFARAFGYQPPAAECPLAGTSGRQTARNILYEAGKEFKHAAYNVVNAAVPLKGSKDRGERRSPRPGIKD